ncbi:LON peptidase substrate-binding domain-containing protein [Agrobacterium pusense]
MPQSIFRRFPLDPLRKLPSGDDPSLFADTVAPLLSVSVEEKQRLLETSDVVTRRKRLIELMNPGRANAVA